MIFVNEPVIGQAEKTYVQDCLDTGWISSGGKYVDQFEADWAAYCGQPHGIAVANGTVALEAAVAAFDFPQGSEIILPTFTIISCAQAITNLGLVPVLVDSEPDTWNMNVAQVAQKITPKTVAIMPVHIYGHPVEMDPLFALAAEHNLKIIEDAAEVHGAEYLSAYGQAAPTWLRCGGMGDVSTFSFYANKLITTGEGGMVLASTLALNQRLRSYRNLCFQPERRFLHDELGNNYRLTNVQAAIGVAQVARIAEIVARKREIARQYTERLASINGIQLPIEKPWAKSVFWMYGFVVDEAWGMDAVDVAKKLHALGVQTRPYFLGMHEQPAFHKMGLFIDEDYPVATRIAKQGLYLPTGLALTDAQIATVCDAMHKVFQ